MQPVVLDTDVASLLQRRKLTGPVATRLVGLEPLITFVTFGELTKWAEIRHWGSWRREELAEWLSGIPVLPGDEAVGAVWGRLSAAAFQRGRPRPVNDMWIAACCLTHEVPLSTLNLKDYEETIEMPPRSFRPGLMSRQANSLPALHGASCRSGQAAIVAGWA